MIPYGRHEITEEDIQAVIKILESEYITQGPTAPLFEKKICDLAKARYATVVNSATSALHLACKALGLSRGDRLWTVPNTFVASANCGLYCGASVDFVDIDPRTFNISISALEEKLHNAQKQGKLPKVLVAVHFGGQPCDMLEIHQLSKEYGFSVIEDASHAVGAGYLDSPVGSCAFSDITVFSFHPVKIITSGEGGAAITNKPELDKVMKLLRSHGITRDSSSMQSEPDGPWYYEQVQLGWNYRMTDIHAALGISQLDRLSTYVRKRNEIADIYDANLNIENLTLPFRCPKRQSACHLYVIQAMPERRLSLFKALRKENIGVNVHYIPIHFQPYYKKMGFKPGDYPNTENYYSRAISLPIFSSMTNESQKYVIEKLIENYYE